jgi:phosphoribosyl 1,2-cyclic phosphate phosphodiesterase
MSPRITILGCGTSGGVPRLGGTPGGHWGVCDPAEPRNRRRRASILVEAGGTTVLVDTTPDMREQCLDAAVAHLDAVLFTHEHADHTNGIDDLRGFRISSGGTVPCYGDARTLNELRSRFGYVFEGSNGYPAIASTREIYGPFEIGDLRVTPFRQQHGNIDSLGFRFGDIAYSTDLVALDDAAKAELQGLDTWIVDALRPQPHPTHANLETTLGWIAELKPRRAILTHMTWEMDYRTLLAELPDGVEPAYDGMVVEAG